MRVSLTQIKVVIVLFFGFTSQAQLIDKGAISVSIVNANGIADFSETLTSGKSKLGFAAAYIINPLKKQERNPPLNVGVELGLMPWGREGFGDFYFTKYGSTWLNGVMRYRPILSASKINPFVDFSGGYYFYNAKIYEQISSEEQRVLKAEKKAVRNFAIGAGVGVKHIKANGDLRYIDLGLYYQRADKFLSIRRGTPKLNAQSSAVYDVEFVQPTNLQIRLGLTGFL